MRTKNFSVKKEIIENTKVSSDCYRMTFESKEIAGQARPGQFLHIRCTESYDPLLRRPISVYSIENNIIEILYKVIGRGTGLLSKKTSGDTIDVLGPLGSGFDYQLVSNCQLPILVGGGIGIAPLYFLAQRLVEQCSNVTVLIGADTKRSILCIDELEKLDCKVKVSTDDGSFGLHGTVVDLLRKELNSKLKVFVCGPVPMLKQVNQLVSKYNVSSQVSLERQMACGVGACMGCAIKTQKLKLKRQNSKGKTQNYKRVCKDGPVFDIKEIVWEEM